MTSDERPEPTAENNGGQTPVVFISYSHDSKEHKEWVSKLAHSLMSKGIDVFFDQFDLGPGDDVPKFMEHAVTNADRVLMVCTEKYVRKADDGKGGVGYEAMIVTGELVKNLGTNKFIPIIRQTSTDKYAPKCMSTRLYIDLSDGTDFDEQMDVLVREIHEAPAIKKPALGKNPFGEQTFEGSAKIQKRESRRLEFADILIEPEQTYFHALDIVRHKDRLAWRKLSMAAAEHGATELLKWKTEHAQIPPLIQEKDSGPLLAHVRIGVDAYAPLFACLIAAAESGDVDYGGQLSWVDTLLTPRNWEDTGTIYWCQFPEVLIFVAQALVGGMLLESGLGDSAYQLAITKLQDKYSRQTESLFTQTRFTGWPDSLNHHCTVAWRFLNELIDSWTWLTKAFGSHDRCRSAVASYYFLLNFLNYLVSTRENHLTMPKDKRPMFLMSSPLCFLVWESQIVSGGYRAFLKHNTLLKRLIEVNGITVVQFKELWPEWLKESGNWLYSVYPHGWPSFQVPHKTFPDDLFQTPHVI